MSKMLVKLVSFVLYIFIPKTNRDIWYICQQFTHPALKLSVLLSDYTVLCRMNILVKFCCPSDLVILPSKVCKNFY